MAGLEKERQLEERHPTYHPAIKYSKEKYKKFGQFLVSAEFKIW